MNPSATTAGYAGATRARRRRLGALFAAGVALAAPAAPAQSIEEALALAYRTNPQLLAERARQRATDEQVALALSNWRPTVTAGSDIGKARDWNHVTDTVTSTTTDNSRVRTPINGAVTVRQPIYRGGRTVADTSRAENAVQRGRALLQNTEQNVLLDAATAFTNLLRDLAVLELQINNEQVLTRQLQATRDRFQVGEVTRTDVAQAEARLERARAQRILAEGNVQVGRAAYLRVIGEPPGRLTAARLPPSLPSSQGQAVQQTGENPAVQAAVFNERAARDSVDLIAGEFLPSVNVQAGGTSANENQTRGVDRDSVFIQLLLSVPLYQAGSVDARVREAKQIVGQRRLEIDDARSRAKEQATTAWEALNTARASIQAFAAQIRANEVALEGVEQEAKVGSRTVLDVLDAEQELLDSKAALVRAQRDEIVAAYQLSAAVGQLTAQKLGLAVEIYDPTAYYNANRDRWWGTDIREGNTAKPQ
jgi:TolC family type I secretion outer membrane protein